MCFYLIIDGELFEKYPALSMGARMLYGFIKFKINIGTEDVNGDVYINYIGDNDPHKALQASKKQILKWTKELIDADLIRTSGSGQHYKVFLIEKFNKPVLELPKGNPRNKPENVVELPKGNPRTQPEDRLELPKGDSVSTQKGTRPLLSYKQTKLNNICIYTTIPSVEEIETEAIKQGYKIDASAFYEYNQMRGWHGVKDWRAALSLWNKNEINHRTKKQRRNGSITGAEAGITYQPAADNQKAIRTPEISPETLDDITSLFGGCV